MAQPQWRAVTHIPPGQDAQQVLPEWARPLLPVPVAEVVGFWRPRSEVAAALNAFINIAGLTSLFHQRPNLLGETDWTLRICRGIFGLPNSVDLASDEVVRHIKLINRNAQRKYTADRSTPFADSVSHPAPAQTMEGPVELEYMVSPVFDYCCAQIVTSLKHAAAILGCQIGSGSPPQRPTCPPLWFPQEMSTEARLIGAKMAGYILAKDSISNLNGQQRGSTPRYKGWTFLYELWRHELLG